jgi:hypothetical protein
VCDCPNTSPRFWRSSARRFGTFFLDRLFSQQRWLLTNQSRSEGDVMVARKKKEKTEIEVNFSAIEGLVHQGKSVVSSDDASTIEWALNAIREDRTATLYVSKFVLQAILERYWTPKRVEFAELRPISAEQAAKIKSDFNIVIDGYANSLKCPRCGQLYSTYEFIQQGIQQHGEEVVRSTFSHKGGVFQINPKQVPVCQKCGLIIIGVGVYHYLYTDPQGRPQYACGATVVIVIVL